MRMTICTQNSMQQNLVNQWDCSGEWTKLIACLYSVKSSWKAMNQVALAAFQNQCSIWEGDISPNIMTNVGSELSLHAPGLHSDNEVAGGTHHNLASVTKFQPVKAHGIHHRPLPHSSLLILYLQHLTNPIIVQCDCEICWNHLGYSIELLNGTFFNHLYFTSSTMLHLGYLCFTLGLEPVTLNAHVIKDAPPQLSSIKTHRMTPKIALSF